MLVWAGVLHDCRVRSQARSEFGWGQEDECSRDAAVSATAATAEAPPPDSGTDATEPTPAPQAVKAKLDEFVRVTASMVEPGSQAHFVVYGYDIETTHLNVYTGRVLELSVTPRLLRLERSVTGEVSASWAEGALDGFDSFLCPFIPDGAEKLCPFTTELTSITQEDVCEAPDFKTVWAQFLGFLAGTQKACAAQLDGVTAPGIFLAHNGHTFDFRYLLHECRRNDIDLGADFATVGMIGIADSVAWMKGMESQDKATKRQWTVDGESQPQKGGKPCYTLGHVVATWFPEYDFSAAHRANADVTVTWKMLQHAAIVGMLGRRSDSLFVTVQCALRWDRQLAQEWLMKHGGYGPKERPQCHCGATTNTALQGSSRSFYCVYAGLRDSEGEWWRGKNGERPCCVFRRTTAVQHLPGFVPKPKLKRAKKDNGVAGACTCAAKCATSTCPCYAAKQKCGEGCSHSQLKGKHQKCTNAPAAPT